MLLLFAVSAVSACDNITDADLKEDDTQELIKIDKEDSNNNSDYLEAEDNSVLKEDNSSADDGVNNTTQKQSSKLTPNSTTIYNALSEKFSVTLTNGSGKLAGKNITFTVNGVNYSSVTNNNGIAILNNKFSAGVYNVVCIFEGDNNTNATSLKSTLTVKDLMPTTLKQVSNEVYRKNIKSPFKVKLTDIRGNPLVNFIVYFKINGKKYSARTNANGIAKINIKLNKGKYSLKYWVSKTSKYSAKSVSTKIKVKNSKSYNNGFWIKSGDMKKVNFAKLKKYATKHIFIHSNVISKYGSKAVKSFVSEASSYGIKVHLWITAFFSNKKWKSPVSKKGKFNYKFMKKKIKLVKKCAKIKGVSGVHLDYLRFPGNAYKYKHAVKAINYFTKKCAKTVHKVSKKLIISAAVMPEPNSMKRSYGQDIKKLSKYLDVMIPMVYKGNYHASSSWIKKVTKIFVKKSKKAQVWTGLQSYKSDSNLKKLSAKSLLKDSKNAAKGGAYGVVIFRYGLSKFFSFNKI